MKLVPENFGCFYHFIIVSCGEFFSSISILFNRKAIKTIFFANASDESVYLFFKHCPN